MQDWNELRVFKAIADHGSLVRAATHLSLPRSTVSKRLADLEGRLGRRLFKRTTRRVVLTPAGMSLHRSVATAFEILEQGTSALLEERGAASELVVISAPPVLSQNVVGALAGELLRRDPSLCVEVRSVVEFDHAGQADVDIRLSAHPVGARPAGSVLVGQSRREIFAAPSLLAARGAPASPDEIAAEELTMRAPVEALVLVKGRKRQTITCGSRLRCVDHETVRDAVIAGAVFGVLPRFVAARAVANGALVQVLPDWRFPPIPIAATVAPFARKRSVITQIVQLLPGALERAGLVG
jgi:DNA-binding transcriptional LysR family regulator